MAGRKLCMPMVLAERLRVATRALHTEVERAGFMQQLLRGQLRRAGYVLLLRNLHVIYSALEDALQRHGAHPRLSRLPLPALARRDALQRDLLVLHGPDWEQLPVVPAARVYAQRLLHLSEVCPLNLAAHAYVRYLGDLNGGQVLARVIASGLGLQAGEGLSFFEFGPSQESARLAPAFRAGLAQLADDEAQAQALVQEACEAFSRHKLLFEQLAALLPVEPGV